MSEKQYGLSVVIGAALSSGFSSILSGSTSKISKLGEAIKQMEKSSTHLSASIVTVKNRYNSLLSSISTGEMLRNKRASYKSQIMDVVALSAALYAPIKSASDLEQSLLGVKQVMNFKAPDGLEKLKKDIIDLSLKTPLASTELANIAARGAANLVSEDKLTSYTKIVSKAVVAWKKDATATSSTAGAILKSWGKNVEDLNELFDMINHLGNKSSGASAGDIFESLRIASANARSFGLKENVTAALTSTLASLKGVSATEAGASISKLLQKLMEIPTLTERIKLNLKKAGLSAIELESLIKTDPNKGLMVFLEQMSKMNSVDRTGLLKELVGGRNSEIVSQLAQNLTLLKTNIDHVSDPKNYKGSLSTEYSNVFQTANAQIQNLKNAFNSFFVVLGDKLLPYIGYAVNAITSLTQKFIDFDKKNPGVIESITKIAGGFIGLKLATFVLGFAWFSLLGVLNKLVIGFKAFSLGFSLISMAVKTHPFMALVSVAALIYANWKSLSNLFFSFFEKFKPEFEGFLNILKEFGITDFIISSWSAILEKFEKLKNLFDELLIKSPALQNMFSSLKEIASASLDWILEKFSILTSFFDSIYNKISNLFRNNMFTKAFGKLNLSDKIKGVFNFSSSAKSPDLSSKDLNIKPASSNIQNNQTNNFEMTINASPNQSPKEIANAIQNRFKRDVSALLFDPVEGNI